MKRIIAVLLSATIACTLWFQGSDARRDAALAAALDAAPFSRFAPGFAGGLPSEGRLRILPLEEHDSRQAARAELAAMVEGVKTLEQHLIDTGPLGIEALNSRFVLAKAENELKSAGTRPDGPHADHLRELLTPRGQALFDQLLIQVQLGRPTVIDRRNEVFAERIVAVTRQLEQTHAPGEAVVVVFTGAGHVPGVAELVEQALDTPRSSGPIDLEAGFRQAMAGVDLDATLHANAQLLEGLNGVVPDVDIGPVRIRGDAHSPYFDAVRFVGFEFFVAQLQDLERDYAVSIARYAALVDEVRALVRDGKDVVFMVELDATDLINSHADVLREERFLQLKVLLAADVLRDRAIEERTPDEVDGHAARIFPFFLIGPSALLLAKLDPTTIAEPILRAAAGPAEAPY